MDAEVEFVRFGRALTIPVLTSRTSRGRKQENDGQRPLEPFDVDTTCTNPREVNIAAGQNAVMMVRTALTSVAPALATS